MSLQSKISDNKKESFHPMFSIFFLILILLGMLFHVPIVINGAHTGLELWYESVLPSILPFMIITSLLLEQVRGKGMCYLGLFCGLPVGANLVNQQLATDYISLSSANALLCICNITSPMFISGYILNQTFHQQVSSWKFFLVIYLPLLFYWLLQFCKNHFGNQIKKNASKLQNPHSDSKVEPKPLEAILKHSLQVILMVGVYIMLFCILIQFLLHYLPPQALVPRLLTGTLEITNGIHLFMQLPISMQQKTALIAGLTSFGGICSILQTKSVLTNNGLSIIHYTFVKLGMGGLSYLLALLLL